MLETLMQWLGIEDASSVIQPRFEFQFWFNTQSAVLLLIAVSLFCAYYYFLHLRKTPFFLKLYLTGSRTLITLLALFLAMNPTITGYLSEPGDQYVLILFDDSKSMQISGKTVESRGDRLLQEYEAQSETFEDKLSDRYRIMKYRVGRSIERIRDEKQLTFQQPESNLVASTHLAKMDISGMGVSAIVLFSDGQDQGSVTGYPVQSLDDFAVPVYTVGTGDVVDWSDTSIAHISYSRSDFDKNPVIANVDIESYGLDGETVIVEIIDGNKVIDSKEIVVDSETQKNTVQFEFVPDRQEWIAYKARVRLKESSTGTTKAAVQDIAVRGKDFVTQNNEHEILVDASKKEYRILYFSGRPNWENKFIRSAIVDEPEFRITSLIRISAAETKFEYKGADTSLTNPLFDGFEQDQEKYSRYDEAVFLRLGAKEHELVKGFPREAEELFEYDGIIFGDIEPDYFSLKQLELTKEFVDKRGGALLILGGDRSFLSEQDSTGILAGMIPALPDSHDSFNPHDPSPHYLTATLEGELSGTLSLSSNPDENQYLWQQMPPLYGVNSLRMKSIGGELLGKAVPETPGERDKVLLASHRYGKGKCAVMAVADTWQWQMQKELEDPYHERLWRQILRYLVSDVPHQIMVRKTVETYVQHEIIPLDVFIQNRKYNALEGAQVEVTVTTPSGMELPLPVDESIQEAGVYQLEMESGEAGMYTLSITAKDQELTPIAEHSEAVLVQPDMREFQNARFNPAFLQDISNRTGGQYFHLSEMSRLVDQLPWNPSEDAKQKTVYLWHHPFFLTLLIVLLSVEWFLRRRKGLA